MIAVFFVVGCGYKPVEQYSKSLFEEPVLVTVKIDPEDPSAGEYLQDEIAKTVTTRLNLKLTKNVNRAKSYIVVNNYTINTTPSNKDDDGNVIRYSVNAAVEFAVKDRLGFWSKNIVASEYVSVKAQSLVSATEKEKAAKVAIKKAVDEFIVAVIQRAKNKKEELEDKNNNQSKPQTQNKEENVLKIGDGQSDEDYVTIGVEADI